MGSYVLIILLFRPESGSRRNTFPVKGGDTGTVTNIKVVTKGSYWNWSLTGV